MVGVICGVGVSVGVNRGASCVCGMGRVIKTSCVFSCLVSAGR